MPDSNQQPASRYGNAGLTPFVLCAALVWILPEHYALPASQVFACYSTVILSFLGGVLWGTALQRETAPQGPAMLNIAIAVSLVSWATLILAMIPSTTLASGLAISIAVNGVAYLILRQSERSYCDQYYPEWFQQLRDWLSRIVLASHISVAVFVIQV